MFSGLGHPSVVVISDNGVSTGLICISVNGSANAAHPLLAGAPGRALSFSELNPLVAVEHHAQVVTAVIEETEPKGLKRLTIRSENHKVART